MEQLQKYTWLIDTIRRAGRISYKELSERWERNRDLSDGKPLHRVTFNRWKDAVFSQFGIIISCQRAGGYLYYIENPEDINDDKLKKWMLDSFAVGNIIGENLSLKGRIIVDEIPSGRDHLVALLEAMRENRVVEITYKVFTIPYGYTFTIEPYCVKFFENRWYMLGRNNRGEIKIYGLDRIEGVKITEDSFKLPKDFSAEEFFSMKYGIVIGSDVSPEEIVVRAYEDHKHYLNSLPLHHSQRLIKDWGAYADFGLYLSPTYDFIMKLLQAGPLIEVRSPVSLRKTMKEWASKTVDRYKDD
ncbi:MAG: WYL domain-containing protein [Muribaculaceae bacterium]|nr:WYL domain-containing protein [Muribaculaceae bacterium]